MYKRNKQQPNLWKYISKYKLPLSFYIIIQVFSAFISMLITIIFAEAIEQMSFNNFSNVFTYLGIALFLTIVLRICWWSSNTIYYKYATKIIAELNTDLAKQAFKLKSTIFGEHGTGFFVQRIVSEPENSMNYIEGIVNWVVDTIASLLMVIYISCLNIYVGLAVLLILLVGILIEYKRIKLRHKNRKAVSKSRDDITSLTTEIVKSEKDIKSLGLEDKLGEISSKQYDDYKRKNAKLMITDSHFWSVRNLFVEVGIVLVLFLGVFLYEKSLIALSLFMLVYSWKFSINDIVWGIGYIGNALVDLKVSCNRMFSLFDESQFETEKFGNVELSNIKGKIEFKNVKYVFREYEFKKENEKSSFSKEVKVLTHENEIFNNLSFKIEPNTTVAFVGKSGSGKSTILSLMSKMYEVDGGEVLIDGVNINDLSKTSLRNAISLINQFPYIFDMTIKENLLLAKIDATDKEIIQALKKAALYDFVNNLPKKLDTKIGENGIKLSGGQRQRLAIARALLRNSPIIIFDESTSSLDNFAQNSIKKSIDKMKGESTIIIVAHRLSTIKNADKIFYLDNGKIVASGTFDELYKNNKSFHNMFLAEEI